MEKQALKKLLDRYIKGECTDDEKRWIARWYNDLDQAPEDMLTAADIVDDLREVRERLVSMERPRLLGVRVRYAAAVLALLVGCVYVFYHFGATSASDRPIHAAMDTGVEILPGGNKATLSVDDGQPIELRGDYTGIVVGDAIAYEDGSLVYTGSTSTGQAHTMSVHPSMMRLTTPRGGQYQITLSDGTRVWMNAASSLRYPAQFDGAIRQVELEGEAYFEVARAEGKPFHVITGDQKVEVLGTEFNVSAYSDEPYIRTTLVAGAVRIWRGTHPSGTVLAPGKQARFDRNQQIDINQTDVASAIAWKDGLFSFDDMDIETMMRQLSRWYDVEVVFEGEAPKLRLWGNMYRNLTASQVLEILTYFNLNFRIEHQDGAKRIVIFS